MPRLTAWVAIVAGAVGVSACVKPLPPQSLQTAKQTRESASVQAAKDLAPQQHAYAQRLVAEADKLYAQGHFAASSIVAERAMVAWCGPSWQPTRRKPSCKRCRRPWANSMTSTSV